MNTTEQTGDVYITSSDPTPVEINEPENVHIKSNSISGDLILSDVEFVFTGQPSDQTDSTEEYTKSIETTYTGSELEDVYVEQATGDVIISKSDDVYIEPSAVSGSIKILGGEKEFVHTVDSPNRAEMDETAFGWKQTVSCERPQNGVIALGSKCTIRGSKIHDSAEFYVTGWENDISLTGRGTVKIHLIGSHNEVTIGGLLNAEIDNIGTENVINEEPFPVEELIDQRKSDAFTDAGYGKQTVTYQEPISPSDDKCPVCRANADAIVETTTVTCFFLFGQPLYTYQEDANYVSCEECSDVDVASVELTEAERQEIL